MAKTSGLDDEKIGALIDQKVTTSTAWFASKLSTEREMVLDYLDRKRPKQREGSASIVTPHVYNAVEMMRAQLGETFSAGSGIVTFDPRGPDDMASCQIASEYTNHVFYQQNDGERILRDVIFDGLTARVGVAKVFWDRDERDEVLEFEGITQDELDAWENTPEITHIEVSPAEDGTYSGRLVSSHDRGQIRVEAVNPEEFSIESHAKTLSEEYFCCHRTQRSVSWIVANYPKMKGREDELRGGSNDELANTPEVLARFRDIDGLARIDDMPIGDEMREVTLVEAYAKFRRAGDLTPQLYRVLRCGTVNIEIEAVESLPFVVFTPLPRPHNFYGENFAKTVIPTQNAATALMRAIIDSASISTNPRWMVAKGGLVNPRELLDNRLGGIVNVRQMGDVMPLNQPQINPQAFSLIQALEGMNEQITGISAMSQGLNKDVISKQNSAALMEQQTNVSQTRQKEIARQFATGFLCPLFEKIYDLVVRYESREDIQIQTGMGWTPVNPWDWDEGRTASASAHLGYGEKKARATEIGQFAKLMESNPVTQQFVGPAGAYAMAADMMTLMGYKAQIARYMPVTPDKLQPPQPNPEIQAKVAHLQADAQSKMILAQAQAKKVDDHTELQGMKLRLADMEAKLGIDLKTRDADRKDAEAKNRIQNSQIETALLVEQSERQPDTAKAIISP